MSEHCRHLWKEQKWIIKNLPFSLSYIDNKIPRRSGVSNTRTARAFCAARDVFWEFSNN